MRVRSAGRVPTNIVRCGHRGAVWVALGLCACGIAERAAAQALTTPETYYVSTMQRLQPGTASPLLASGNRYLTSTSLHYVQPFTTGSRRGGYGVNEVRVALAQERGYVAEMHIVGTEDQSGRPTSSATTTSATFPSISADAPLLTADAGLAQYFFKFEGDLGTGRRYVPRDTVLGIVLLQGTGEGSNDDTVTWSTHVGEPAVAFGWGLHNHHWARNTDDSGWDQVSGEEVDLNIGYPTAPVFDGNMTVGTRTVGGTVNRGFEGEGSNTFGSLALADATLGASPTWTEPAANGAAITTSSTALDRRRPRGHGDIAAHRRTGGGHRVRVAERRGRPPGRAARHAGAASRRTRSASRR